MGAPGTSFCRLDARPIRLREPIDRPDVVVVQDPTLLASHDVFAGLGPEGWLLVAPACARCSNRRRATRSTISPSSISTTRRSITSSRGGASGGGPVRRPRTCCAMPGGDHEPADPLLPDRHVLARLQAISDDNIRRFAIGGTP
jgi:hypothetical protein